MVQPVMCFLKGNLLFIRSRTDARRGKARASRRGSQRACSWKHERRTSYRARNTLTSEVRLKRFTSESVPPSHKTSPPVPSDRSMALQSVHAMPRPRSFIAAGLIAVITMAALLPGGSALEHALFEPLWILLIDEGPVPFHPAILPCTEHPDPLVSLLPSRGPPPNLHA